MTAAELAQQAHAALGSWPNVARALGWSPSLWWQIARGKPATREQENALRRRAGLPEIQPSPVEVVAASGVRYVVEVERNGHDPDTAILAHTGGVALAAVKLVAATGEADARHAPKGTFTKGKINAARDMPMIPTMSNIGPLDRSKLGRGRSGYHPAIEAAARCAAEAMEVTE